MSHAYVSFWRSVSLQGQSQGLETLIGVYYMITYRDSMNSANVSV